LGLVRNTEPDNARREQEMLPFRGATGEPALLARRVRDINYFALIPTLFYGKAE